MKMIENNDRFTFQGGVYTVDEFSNAFLEENMKPYALQTIQLLQQRGEVQIYEQTTPAQDVIKQAMAENMVIQAANQVDELEEMQKDARAQELREGRLTYPEIKINFNSYADAINAQRYITEQLRIQDTEIKIKGYQHTLIAYNVTDKELDKINKYYNLGRATGALISGAKTMQETTAKSVDYAIKNIVAPLTDISLKTGASLASTMATAGVRTAATAVNAVKHGMEKTAQDITNDTEVLRATRELLEAKSAIKSFFGKKIGGVSKGIEVTYNKD